MTQENYGNHIGFFGLLLEIDQRNKAKKRPKSQVN